MSNAQNEPQPSTQPTTTPTPDTDTTDYQSTRGCLTLTALMIAGAAIMVLFLILFGSPPQ